MVNDHSEDDVFFDETTEEWRDEHHKTLALMADALGDIMGWLVSGSPTRTGWHLCVFRKTLALVWCLRPDLLGNKSLPELGKMKGVKSKVNALSNHVALFTEEFGRYHGGTKSVRAKQAYKQARKEYLKKQEGGGDTAS